MELSINISNLFGRYDGDFGKCIDVYKTAGFTACDYGLGGLTQDACPFCGDGYRAAAEEIRRIADEKEFPITQTHAPFNYGKLWNDPVACEEIIMPRVIRSLEISAILGAKVSVVHPLHSIVYRGNEERLFEMNMDFYHRLIPYAKEYGVKIAIENMFQADPLRKFIVADTCSDPDEFIRYIDTLDSEYVVACLDVGHAALPLSDYEAQDIVRKLGHDRLQSLHIHDNDYRSDQHLLPYLGKLNWMEIAKALGEIDYQGDFTYEVKGTLVSDCDEGFVKIGAKYMADVGKHIISEIERCRVKK